MDKVYSEEKERLDYVIRTVNNEISELETSMPFPGVHLYSTGYDRDERENLFYQKSVNSKHYEKIKYYHEFKDSPYFARMDFNVKENQMSDYVTMYIGKKSLNIDNEYLVYDWRSPIGQRYYLKNELEFIYNKYYYNVLLRRALDIKDGDLLKCYDEYVLGDEIFEGGVADPFLVQTLREKRGEYKLTDIIKTIQMNQNNIIRYPLQNSIIVQGCAGSGKTMIMLHRLSYIKFNNPSLDLNSVKIITPNELFDVHINELSENLELENIQRFTVEKYYLYLLSQYDKNMWKNISEILPESKLNQQFVNYIYSGSFYAKCKNSYDAYVCNVRSEIRLKALEEICTKYSYSPYSEPNTTDKYKIDSYKYFIMKIESENESYKKQYSRDLDIIRTREKKKNEAELELFKNSEYMSLLDESEDYKKRVVQRKSKLDIQESYYNEIKSILDNSKIDRSILSRMFNQDVSRNKEVISIIESIIEQNNLLHSVEEKYLVLRKDLIIKKESIMQEIHSSLPSTLVKKVDYLTSQITFSEQTVLSLDNKQQMLNEKVDEGRKELYNLKEVFALLSALSKKIKDGDLSNNIINETLSYVDNADDFVSQLKKLSDLENDLKATPFLNIFKTLRLRNEISLNMQKLRNKLYESVNNRLHYILQKISSVEKQISVISNDKQIYETKISEEKEKITSIKCKLLLYKGYIESMESKIYDDSIIEQVVNSYDEQDSEIKTLYDKLHEHEIITLKYESEYFNSKEKISQTISVQSSTIEKIITEELRVIVQEKSEIEKRIIEYDTNLSQHRKGIDSLEKEINEHNNRLIECKKKIMSSEDENIVETARRKIESITPVTIFDNTFGLALSNTEEEYNIKHSRGFYRFNLYIYLSFWFLYSGKLVKNDRYINVDEGQDIAIFEYKVFNQVNGGRVVFNIYGDTNQLIKTGRGIHDWGQLIDMITADVFTLNENYRNTREITNYCNKKLDFNSISIGITGEEVRHIQQTEAILELKKSLNTKLKKRIAIIVNSLLNPVVGSFLDIEGIFHNSIKDGAISILVVEHAKGLEFDIVYVIPDGMSKNEKYIAFTRALSELIIIEG